MYTYCIIKVQNKYKVGNKMEITKTRNGKNYIVDIEIQPPFMNKVTVYKENENGDFIFMGKAISIDIDKAIDYIIK